MDLHYTPGTVSIAVAIALEEAGLAYTPRFVDFRDSAQTQAPYLAINPKGRVPALVTDQGVLTETGAILDYIGTLAPVMVPTDPFAAAQMRELMYYIASTMHVAHAHKMRGSRWADQETSLTDMRAKVPQTVSACCAYLESKYPFSPFVFGSNLTLADPYLFIVASWGTGDDVDMSAYPKLAAFIAMMRARPSVQAVTSKGMLS